VSPSDPVGKNVTGNSESVSGVGMDVSPPDCVGNSVSPSDPVGKNDEGKSVGIGSDGVGAGTDGVGAGTDGVGAGTDGVGAGTVGVGTCGEFGDGPSHGPPNSVDSEAPKSGSVSSSMSFQLRV